MPKSKKTGPRGWWASPLPQLEEHANRKCSLGSFVVLKADHLGRLQVYRRAANLRTNIMDFRGFDSSIILILTGWNSHVHRGFPRKFESSDLSRDNLSREIGRRCTMPAGRFGHAHPGGLSSRPGTTA